MDKRKRLESKLSKIKSEDIGKLREVVGEDIFPYMDYTPENTVIQITLTHKDTDTGERKYLSSSREYDEAVDGILPEEIRNAILDNLHRYEPNIEMINKLKMLGIEIVFPMKKKFRMF